jgi:hypothetical protein
MSTVRSRVLFALVDAVPIISPVPTVYAQVRIAGAISKTVKDSSDAVVPGARVVLNDEATNATRETVSSGLFRFPDPAGVELDRRGHEEPGHFRAGGHQFAVRAPGSRVAARFRKGK